MHQPQAVQIPPGATRSPAFPTHEMVRSRTEELASIAGRGPHHIRQTDYEQAKRELTGETELDRQLAVLAGLLKPSSVGHPAAVRDLAC